MRKNTEVADPSFSMTLIFKPIEPCVCARVHMCVCAYVRMLVHDCVQIGVCVSLCEILIGFMRDSGCGCGVRVCVCACVHVCVYT